MQTCAMCGRDLPGLHLGVEIGSNRFLHVCRDGPCASRAHNTRAAQRWHRKQLRRWGFPPDADRGEDQQRGVPCPEQGAGPRQLQLSDPEGGE